MFHYDTDVDLKKEQEVTLNTPRMKYCLVLKIGFIVFDLIYGKKRTIPKFKVLEIMARIPYWAWENVSYYRLTNMFSISKRGEVLNEVEKRSYEHIELGRISQDNEQWHMTLLDELMQQKGLKLGLIKGKIIPVCVAIGYFLFSRILYWINPAWSLAMNAAFEDHAEHEYMYTSQENPEWDEEKLESKYKDYYPVPDTVGDLIRRIGLDERIHKEESLEAEKLWRETKKN